MSLQDRDGGGVPSQHGVLGWYGTSRWDGEPGQWGGRDARAPLGGAGHPASPGRLCRDRSGSGGDAQAPLGEPG